MKTSHLRDQRGVAMLLELVLVAAVLGLVGLAVYQSNHTKSPTASTAQSGAAPASADGLAASAASVTIQDSAADTSLSASADSAASNLSEPDSDVTNLGGSVDANSF